MKQLVGYITASYPNKNFSIDLALSLKESGVDKLELGIPFSDPVADGEVIEKANLYSLKNGFKVDDIFDISKEISNQIDTLLMGYMNPFYNRGIDYFIKQSKDLNIKGLIIPDMPYEESLIYRKDANDNNIALIDFIAPTTPKDRIKMIVKNSKEFIYLVAYAGITGSGIKEDLTETINNIKEFSDTPIYIGFGVNKETAKEKAKNVDGVIVGSAFVNYLNDNTLSNNEKIAKITLLAKNIKEIIND